MALPDINLPIEVEGIFQKYAAGKDMLVDYVVQDLMVLLDRAESLNFRAEGADSFDFFSNFVFLGRISIERAKHKLRMLCARLCVLCNEHGGGISSPYGGASNFSWMLPDGKHLPVYLSFCNTPDRQEIVLRKRCT